MLELLESEIERLTKRVDGVLDYIEKNPDSDPNAYEMMELTIEVGGIGGKMKNYGETVSDNAYQYAIDNPKLDNLRKKYFKMMNIRLNSMKENKNNLNLGEGTPLYDYLESSKHNIITYNGITKDPEEKEAMCKLAGVDLYINQRKRDLQKENRSEVIYDNKEEFEKLANYYKARPTTEIQKRLLVEVYDSFNKEFTPRLMGLDDLVADEAVISESYISDKNENLNRDNDYKNFEDI